MVLDVELLAQIWPNFVAGQGAQLWADFEGGGMSKFGQTLEEEECPDLAKLWQGSGTQIWPNLEEGGQPNMVNLWKGVSRFGQTLEWEGCPDLANYQYGEVPSLSR